MTLHVFAGVWMAAVIIWLTVAVITMDNDPPPAGPKKRPDDPTELLYCAGCGCNHRRMWMRWSANHTLRCLVCCRDREGTSPHDPPLDPL